MRDALKVKDAMLDSCNDSISELKAEVEDAAAHAAEARAAAEAAQGEARSQESEHAKRLRSFREEIESQEQAIEKLEKAASEAAGSAERAQKRVAELQAALREKDEVLKYVEAEVDRAKQLFDEKHSSLAAQLSDATNRQQQAEAEASQLRARAAEAEGKIGQLTTQLELAQQQAATGVAAATQHRRQAAAAARRVAEVESELREVLSAVEVQRHAAAHKMARLAAAVGDLQLPLQLPAPPSL